MPNEWYLSLVKPSWTPEPATIGLVWTILYLIIIGTFIYVCYLFAKGRVDQTLLIVFIINIIANIIFTPIQFGLKNLPLASLDIFIVWSTIIGVMYLSWSSVRLVAYLQAPYLLWVSIAMVLQFSITFMNR